MKIEFHGAARTVTGSRHLLKANGHQVLLDCGLFQGRRDESDRLNREFGFNPRDVDAVVMSHAHIDHSGALPSLVKNGFKGCIHSTMATADLLGLMLRDSAYIQEKDIEFLNKRRKKRKEPPKEALYTIEMDQRRRATGEMVRTGWRSRALRVRSASAARPCSRWNPSSASSRGSPGAATHSQS